MKQMNIFSGAALALASSMLLVACGGGNDANPAPPATPVNVALATNGGITTATVNSSSTIFLNDGVTTTTNYWSGTAINDTITVNFNKSYSVSNFILYLNLTNNTDTEIQVSADGTTFTTPDLISTCSTLILGSGKINCTFLAKQNLMAMRVVIKAGTNAANVIHLYELEVTGQ